MNETKIAVDSSVILTILKGQAQHEAWRGLIVDLLSGGKQLVSCDVVWAEVAVNYTDEWMLCRDLNDLGIEFDPLQAATSYLAGQMYCAFAQISTAPRRQKLADFLVGAHALRQAKGLLTCDAGYARSNAVKGTVRA